MTQARTSAGDSITIKQATNSDQQLKDGVRLLELKSAPAIGGTPNQVDATSLDDTVCKVYIPGLADYGILDFTFNLMPHGIKDPQTNKIISNFDILSKVNKNETCELVYTLANHGVTITLDNVFVDFEIGGADVDAARELVMHCTMADGPTITGASS